MSNSEVQQVRKYLINTDFYIKEHKNNYLPGSIISISYETVGNGGNPLIIFNEKDFTVLNLKNKIDEALISNEPIVRNQRNKYYELDTILGQLYRDLIIDKILEN